MNYQTLASSPVRGADGADVDSGRWTRGTFPAAPGGRRTAKVAIVGAGRVGTTLAYTCLVRGLGKSIALYGRDPERLRAEVLDLNHGLQFVPMATVIGSTDLEVTYLARPCSAQRRRSELSFSDAACDDSFGPG